MEHRFLRLLILCLCLFSGYVFAGPRVVKEIVVDGAKSFSQAKIKKLMLTKEKKWHSGILSDLPYYRESLLKADLKRIEWFYHSKGYPKVELEYEIKSEKENDVIVVVRVKEGIRYRLGKVDFVGNRVISSDELCRVVAFESGKPLDFNSIQKAEDKIKALYGDRGYPYASVKGEYELIDSTRTVDVRFIIDEGKLAYFGETSIWGLAITDTQLVLRECRYKKGDIYSARLLLRTKERLLQRDIFEIATVGPLSLNEKPDTVPVRINVVEKRTWFAGTNLSLATNPNYDLAADIVGELGNRNIEGSGRRASIKALSQFELITRYRNLKNIFTLTYNEPYPLGCDLPLKMELYFEPGNRSESEQYRLQRLGVKINSSYYLSEKTVHQFSISYERVDIFGVRNPAVIEEIKLSKGIRIKRTLGYTMSRDSRDNVFVPAHGSNSLFYCEYAGLGGDDNYLLMKFSWSRYISLRDGLIYTSRILVGGIGNLRKDEDVPPHNRLFLGGGSTMRGFPEKGLGPKDADGFPLGGKALFLANFELRAHIIWRMWATGFVDIGNLWGSIEQVTPSQLRATAGWGIAFMSPVGPLRFDYAYHIRKLDPDAKPRWHIGIFYAF